MTLPIVYVVAPDYSAYIRWVGKQDPDGKDGIAVYRFYRGDIGIRSQRPSFLFLKGWQTRPDWRQVYNQAISQGRVWWE